MCFGLLQRNPTKTMQLENSKLTLLFAEFVWQEREKKNLTNRAQQRFMKSLFHQQKFVLNESSVGGPHCVLFSLPHKLSGYCWWPVWLLLMTYLVIVDDLSGYCWRLHRWISTAFCWPYAPNKSGALTKTVYLKQTLARRLHSGNKTKNKKIWIYLIVSCSQLCGLLYIQKKTKQAYWFEYLKKKHTR